MRQRHHPRRRAASLVEFAMVATVFLLFLFGIIEFARYVFVRNVVINATREGARYAVVHSQDASIVADTKVIVEDRLTGVKGMLKSYNCSVFYADSSNNNIGTPLDAPFGGAIAVRITADFEPILPSFLMFGSKMPVNYQALMLSEAN